jgi:transcriptional/translational regulatory protein YebC/TACO1
MKQFEYECYGPNGIQIIVTALAENENRVVSNLRGYLSKLHGEIAKANSVKIFFENFGIIVLQKINTFQTKDDIEEIIINNNLEGYIETKEYEDSFEVFTEPNNSFYKIRDELIKNSFKVFESSIKLVSSSKVTNVDEDTKQRMQRFIESCENDDDIQSVITNYEEE